ncbi:MAG: oligosaccharide flippase family protein [Ardenticatenaceae bacterium]|nr:oligosaccharide flippase family protein [Ardenticatenaceae bacterium]MCB8973760.1 oligosaccharide flippase family protein [Ardenticatenaceae bacterium]
MKRFRTDLLFLLGFLLLPLLLFGSVTLGGKTMLPVDNLYQWAPWSAYASEFGLTQPHNPLISDLIIQNYAWKQFVRETIFARDIPLWNPNLFAGVPFLAAGQHGAYYPFSLLFLILPLAKAYGWYTVSQIWLAGALMYVYGRILKLHRPSAFIAGLVFQGGAYLVISAAVFPMISGAVVWLPLLLACVERVIRDWRPETRDSSSLQSPVSNRFWWIALGAVALGFQILAGHIEFTIYTLVVMAAYAAWRLITQLPITNYRSPFTVHRLLKPAVFLLAMVLLGLMLGAVQLVPLYELGQENFRQESASFDEVLSYSFPARRVLTLALPNFFGNPTHHSYTDVFSGEEIPLSQNYYGEAKTNTEWGIKNYVEGAIYLGILPLFLAAVGVLAGWRRRKAHVGFFAILSFFSLAFIFGTPLYAILYYGLPFVNQLHTPFRWVFPLSLAVAVLAGFGVENLETGDWRLEIRRISLQSLVSNLAATGGILLLVGLVVSWVAYGRFQTTIERIFLGLAGAPSAFADATAFYSYTFWQLLMLGLVLLGVAVVFWLSKWGGKRPYWILAAALLIIVDIFLANRGFNASNEPALLDFKPEMVQWLEAQPGYWRITSFAPNGDKPFNANSGWLFDLPDVRGYDSIIPKQYTEYMAAIEPQNELPFNRVQPIVNWESLNSPLLDVLGVKYVITSETIELPKYIQVWQGEGVRIYENAAVAPRAYTLPLTATAVSDDSLAAMTTQFDPRQFVNVETGDWRLETISVSSLQSPTSSPSPYQPATVTAYTNREAVLETAVTEPSWLILNDSYFPGWKAWIRPSTAPDDEEIEVPITRVNGNFRGVMLQPGEWQVRFRYSPTSFQLGALGSFMAGIILLFGAVVWGWQRFYRADGEQSVTRSLAKNSLAPIALNLFNKLIDFGFAAFYLRLLGPAGSGSFQTAIVTAGIFDIIANFGLDILLIRDVASDRDKAPNYLLNTTVLRLGAGAVAALPVIAIIAVTNLSPDATALTRPEILATAFIMIGMVFSGMSKGVTGLFYVHEEAEVPNAMTTVTTILKVGFGVTALLLGFGFVGLAAVSILTNVITLSLLLAIALRRYTLRGPWRLDWQLQRHMLRAGFPLMLIHLLQTVFISIDSYLLRVLLDNGQEVAGWYSSAYKWFNALQIVPSFFTLALFPIISRRIGESLDAARQMYAMSLKLMLLLALPVAAVTHYLAVPLVQIVAGAEFLPAGAVALQIVIWSIPLGWLNSVTNYVLISLGLESKQPRAFTVAVLFNIIANFIFIPRYSYVAAGVTTIMSELVLLVLFDYYLRQKMAGINWLGLWGRPFLLTALMFGGMWLGGQVHLVVGLLIGAIIYPAGLLLLGIIGPEERKVLGNILPQGLARRLRLL